MNDALLAWAGLVRADLAQEAGFRPHPTDVMELARILVEGGSTRSFWARQMAGRLDEMADTDRSHEWVVGYARALESAAVQAMAIQRDVRSAQAPPWDELFRDELGGPDLRLIHRDINSEQREDEGRE